MQNSELKATPGPDTALLALASKIEADAVKAAEYSTKYMGDTRLELLRQARDAFSVAASIRALAQDQQYG